MPFLEDLGSAAGGLNRALLANRQFGLQEEANDIRQERADALNRQTELEIAQAPTPEDIETQRQFRLEELDQIQGKNEAREREEKEEEESNKFVTLDGFLDDLPGVVTPSQKVIVSDFIATSGVSFNEASRTRKGDIQDAMEGFQENPALMKSWHLAAITDADKKIEGITGEILKLQKKESKTRDDIDKMDELATEIEALRELNQQSNLGVNTFSEQDVLSTDKLESLAIQDIADKETGGDLIEAIKAFKERVEGQQSGNEFREQIDALNLQQNEQEPVQVSPLSREAILRATGFQAGAFKFLAKAAGSFLPGEQFPKTQDAINDINLFNQQVVAAVALSPRFNEGEINRIKKFLIPGGSFFSDPPFALRQLLGLRDIFETNNTQMLNAINSGTVAPKQTEEFIEKININNIVLNLIPSRELLQSPNIFKQQQQGKTVEDINNMNVEQIRNIPFSQAKLFPKEVKAEMLRRIESGSKAGASGSF